MIYDAEAIKKVKKTIIRKLYSAGCWGKGHMLMERFKSGLPAHYQGYVTDALDELIKERIICAYGRTKYGPAFYLNISKKKEIEEMIFESI